MRVFPDAFPSELALSQALALALGSVILGAAVFAWARGRRGFSAGAAFGLLASATGCCASRWPQLCRAIELCGGVFSGLILSAVLPFALAATHALVAAALLRVDLRPARARIIWALVAAWVVATAGTQALLTRAWGFGPRSLAEAAGVPSNRDARRLAVAWLYPSPGRTYHIDERLMSTETVDLSLGSLSRLEAFLERARFRGIFAAEALSAVRQASAVVGRGARFDRWSRSRSGACDYRRALDHTRRAIDGGALGPA